MAWTRHTLILSLVALFAATSPSHARTSNGNDFALEFSSARTPREAQALLGEARGRPHYFRYLQILRMQKKAANGRTFVELTALEPSSYMHVDFTVSKGVSLSKLEGEPASKVGDAIGVVGKIASIEKNTILLNPVIVKHKDRLAPKIGKEMYYELDLDAVCYTYTGGGEGKVVMVTYRDRDILPWNGMTFENSAAQTTFIKGIIEKYGKENWADYLIGELKRKRAEEAAKPGD